MLHTQRGIQCHNVGGVGHFSIHNGQEKNTVNPYYGTDKSKTVIFNNSIKNITALRGVPLLKKPNFQTFRPRF